MTRRTQNNASPVDASELWRTVELCCGGCGRVWAKSEWRSSGGRFDRGTRLGVTVTPVRPGPNGAKRYRCGCGFVRVIDTAALARRYMRAASLGHGRVVAGKDV